MSPTNGRLSTWTRVTGFAYPFVYKELNQLSTSRNTILVPEAENRTGIDPKNANHSELSLRLTNLKQK